ncbi:S8 family serine peptidase [Nonomuraea gerenzanensis]|uniref:Serine protease (Membrane protein) n=1 Tax=Nonomuraea gerenzanensis TaxID=93944 RepID=A0A1M4EPC6_9ACTN|nr:S8 family serine peptidase [Nonomuraea gerenzanensis]UBU12189.1 S8 family serine peptidase [Nonomuraea gerenzanensis]SBP00711.1 serine protease (membrane protein) [Nonomuraea gerenzanensis]
MLTVVRVLTAAVLAFSGTAPDPVRDQQQWVLDALNVEQAWSVTKGEGVTVAVVDSAVDTGVKELKGRVTSGPDMTSSTIERELPPGRHGTAMAGLIAASGEDDGLIGVAPGARILSLPMVIDDEPGFAVPPVEGEGMTAESPLARALRYAANHGAQVVSMSIGSYGPLRSEREAVSYALGKGVVLVAAVGNDGLTQYAKEKGTSYWSFPAGYPGVIGVAATDKQGRRATFSSDNLSVLVAAPGVEVPVLKRDSGYELSEGTSSAAALVAGVAALIKSRYPSLAPEQVAQALASSARGRPAAGYDDQTGFGVVDAVAALNAAERLTGAKRSIAPGMEHFGQGEDSPVPSRPGPDPLRLWLYGGGVLVALVAFCGAIIVLNQHRQE